MQRLRIHQQLVSRSKVTNLPIPAFWSSAIWAFTSSRNGLAICEASTFIPILMDTGVIDYDLWLKKREIVCKNEQRLLLAFKIILEIARVVTFYSCEIECVDGWLSLYFFVLSSSDRYTITVCSFLQDENASVNQSINHACMHPSKVHLDTRIFGIFWERKGRIFDGSMGKIDDENEDEMCGSWGKCDDWLMMTYTTGTL